MERYELSDEAQSALEGIVLRTIKTFGRKQAERVAQRVFESAERLSEMPSMGHGREDLTSAPLLFWTIRNFGITLIYDPESKPLYIIHIVGPGQDVEELLKDATGGD